MQISCGNAPVLWRNGKRQNGGWAREGKKFHPVRPSDASLMILPVDPRPFQVVDTTVLLRCHASVTRTSAKGSIASLQLISTSLCQLERKANCSGYSRSNSSKDNALRQDCSEKSPLPL